MKQLKLISAFLMTIAISSQVIAADGDEAMFGLRWGMSPSDVKSLDTILTKTEAERNLEYYSTTSLPKNVSDVDKYLLIFADGKLVKITVIGKEITGDPSGSSGKQRFEGISKSLSEKYGKASQNNHLISHKLYTERDEFYQCLGYRGCGIWVSIFETTDKIIGLELKGIRRGVGYLRIATEANPQWSEALNIFESKKNASDKDAL
jgi:hypothetical protein